MNDVMGNYIPHEEDGTRDGGAVFPNYERGMALPIGTREVRPIGGMSLRDYFAAQALVGFISQAPAPFTAETHATVAFDAYRLADAMLKARKK